MPRDSTYEKTVYILGAGFSIPAGGPSQDKILEKVIDLSVGGNNELQTRHRRLLGFLESTFKILPAEIKHLSLEDLYTPIDRCLAYRSAASLKQNSKTFALI